MAIVKETTKVFFQGINFELTKGNKVQDNSPLVSARPELFEITAKSAPRVRKVEKVETPKEELLIEEPVAELEVTEEVTEEKQRRKRK